MKYPIVFWFQIVFVIFVTSVSPGLTQKIKLLAPKNALEGEDVTLLCEYAVQEEDIYSIRWYKGSREFLHVTLNDLPKHKISKVSGVNINLQDGISGTRKLVLKDVGSRSSGRYRCELVLKPLSFNQTLKSKPVKLLVKPLQVLVGSLDGTQYLRRGVDGHLVCACEADHKAVGIRTVVWSYMRRDGTPKEFIRIDEIKQEKPSIKYTRMKGINVDVSRCNSEQIYLRRIGRRASGTYLCKVIQKEKVICNHTALIRVIDAPVMRSFTFPASISIGRPVSAICSVTEGHRPFAISFTKDGVSLKKDLVVALDGFSSQILIPTTTLEDNGVYTCSASNPVGKATSSATLNIHRKLHITSLVVPSVAKVGTDTNLHCDFSPHMDAHTVIWIANKEPIFAFYLHNSTKDFLKETSLSINIDKSNGSVLSLHNVRRQHSGNYTCKVEGSHAHLNGVQDSQTRHMSITESGMEPKVQIISLAVPSHVPKGNNIQLHCEYDLLKYSLYEVNWYHNGDTIFRYVKVDKEEPKVVFPKDGINVNIGSSSANVLFLQDIGVAATGTYSCEATIDGPPFTTVYKSANMTVIESSLDMSLTAPEEVSKGEDVDLRCDFQDRAAVALKWFHNDKIFIRASLNGRKFRFVHISPDMNVDVQASTGKLVLLRNVNETHSGVYRCEVTTAPDLKIATRSATVTVRGSSVTLRSQDEPQFLLQGGKATLVCSCVLPGLPVVIKWSFGNATIMVLTTKDNNITTLQHRNIHIDSTLSSAGKLILKDMSWDSSGVYRCTIQSVSGPDNQMAYEYCSHTASVIFLGRANSSPYIKPTRLPEKYVKTVKYDDELYGSSIKREDEEIIEYNNDDYYTENENQDDFEIGNVLGLFTPW